MRDSQVTVRLAERSDLDAMAGLLGELFAQEAEFHPDTAAQGRGLEMVMADRHVGRLLVAENRDGVVAMVSLLYLPSTALGARVALLEDMVVSQAHRSRGVGGALLRAAVARARDDGCARITLLSDADNPRAHGFYERAGFRRSSMVALRLLLDA